MEILKWDMLLYIPKWHLSLHHICSHQASMRLRRPYDEKKRKNGLAQSDDLQVAVRFRLSGMLQRMDMTILTFELKVSDDRRKTRHREPIFQPPHGHPPVTLLWHDDFFVPRSARRPASHLAVQGLGSAGWRSCSEAAWWLLRMAGGRPSTIRKSRNACPDLKATRAIPRTLCD